jgi:hypothetical protein
MTSTIQQGFPKLSTPLATIDPDTNEIRITMEWLRLLLALWNNAYAFQVKTGIVAAGTRIDTATPIQADWNEVATVPANSGVVMLQLAPGQDVIVWNAGANALNVYPDPTYSIDTLAVGAPYVLAVGKMQWFRTVAVTSGSGRMRSMQLG